MLIRANTFVNDMYQLFNSLLFENFKYEPELWREIIPCN